MTAPPASKQRLSKQDWTDAALTSIATHGTAGINVEQLARSLDTTKGSFYHHFKNRQALLEAALARWEEIVEADLIEADALHDPKERLMRSSLAGVGTGVDGFVEIALAASIDDPAVATTLRRTNQKRITYLTGLLEELGVPKPLCRDRATFGLATYLGLYQLQHVTGTRFSPDDIRVQILHALESMLSD